MLGSDGLNWVERLQFQIAKDLRAMEWSQSEIAEVLGTTQSTISRQYHREAPKLHGSADEILIDDLARDISEKLDRMGFRYRLNQTTYCYRISIRRPTANPISIRH